MVKSIFIKLVLLLIEFYLLSLAIITRCCINILWNIINAGGCKLEEIIHPFVDYKLDKIMTYWK